MALRNRCALALAPIALFAAVPAHAGPRAYDGDWATASDIAAGGLVAWSVGVPLIDGDEKGALQAGLSIAAAQGVSQLLKLTVHETRPDGSDDRSFASAHSAMAFAAATSILKRRGPEEGIPAMAVAGFTGLARVEAGKHYWHDVAAGAAIGGVSGFLLTDALPDRRIALSAWGDTKGAGVSVAMAF